MILSAARRSMIETRPLITAMRADALAQLEALFLHF